MLRGVLILDAPEMVDILDEWNRVDLESLLIFFFSSRRRHMRCLSDWSSDVCSSDLPVPRRADPCRRPPRSGSARRGTGPCRASRGRAPWLEREIQLVREALVRGTPYMGLCLGAQIGRASCRERV